MALDGVAGLLLDLDGVFYVGDEAVPGSVAAARDLARRGYAIRFLTNTTMRSRAALLARLRALGLDVAPEQLLTPAVLAARLMGAGGGGPYRLVAHPDLAADLGPGAVPADAEGPGERPRWVVLGLHPPYFRHEVLGVAFRDLLAGARLVALHANRMWRTPRGMEPGLGMVVRGLEHAAGVEATVVGKPARPFFAEALGTLDGIDAARVIMVGDDVESDVGGAQGAGLRGVLVRTGKFSEATLAASGVEPDLVVDDLAALARLLPARPAPAG